ncbi:hypothetical protein MBLNU230_g6954t1 [Neophaeotheca triangularis]
MNDLSPTSHRVRAPQQSVMYPRGRYGVTETSVPYTALRSDAFGQGANASVGTPQMYGASPEAERRQSYQAGIVAPALTASTSDPMAFGQDPRSKQSIVIRRLPRTISSEALGSMLIFAGDLISTELIRSPYADDMGFATAMAHFRSQAGAQDAQQKLNGKPNTAKEANMIVELHSSGIGGMFERRNTIDGTASRNQTSSSSSGGSMSGGAPPGRSRYGSTFQSQEKTSPPLSSSNSGGSAEFPAPESNTHFQNLFSPQSPLANNYGGRHISGKSMINDDSADDETGELLKDPVAYAKSGQVMMPRRPTNTQPPLSQLQRLSLNTNSNGMSSPPSAGIGSPRSAAPMQSPMSANGMGPNGGFQPNYPKHQYPPVNPADQNPPCNTLYVGNLPIDTSEDELKALFSKQRGYRRLCFRTKQNGPMCFVEFEDVSFATKALNELYGIPLHNSVKGGIRLSFSKNPLGVRSGQAAGFGLNPAMSPQAMAPGYTGNPAGNSFSSASGPPPGLSAPPGLASQNGYRQQPHTGLDGMFANAFNARPELSPQSNPRNLSGGVPAPMGGGIYGRDAHGGNYSDYMLGR